MTPRLSKFMLTTHIALSVAWVGAVAGFLALSIASLTSKNTEIVRRAYLSMNLIGVYVIVLSLNASSHDPNLFARLRLVATSCVKVDFRIGERLGGSRKLKPRGDIAWHLVWECAVRS